MAQAWTVMQVCMLLHRPVNFLNAHGIPQHVLQTDLCAPVGDRSSICFHNLCWIFHVEQRVTEYLALANRQEDLRVEPLMAAQYFVMIWVIGHSQIEHEDGLILVDPKKIRNALEDTEESIFVHRLEVAALSSQIEHVPSDGAWQDFVVLQDVVQNIVQVASSARDHPEFDLWHWWRLRLRRSCRKWIFSFLFLTQTHGGHTTSCLRSFRLTFDRLDYFFCSGGFFSQNLNHMPVSFFRSSHSYIALFKQSTA